MVVAIGVVVLMLVKVIPTFEKMFADFGGELPGPTQMVVNLSHFMQEWIWLPRRRIARWSCSSRRARGVRSSGKTDALA